MKILVVADSHGKKENLKIALESDEYDKIIYVGDGIKDLLELSVDKTKLILVKGNNDITKVVPQQTVVEIEGKRFFITHGDEYNVKYGFKNLIEEADKLNANVVIFAHTHISLQTKLENGMILINPGSISKGKLNQNTFAIIDIDAENNIFDCNICQVC